MAVAKPQPSDNWLIVTTASNMPRAVASFGAVGFSTIPYPAGNRTRISEFKLRFNAIAEGLDVRDKAAQEWLGLVAYRLSGKTHTLLPARDEDLYFAGVEEKVADPQMMPLVQQFIKQQTRPWDPKMVADPAQDKLLELIALKEEGFEEDREGAACCVDPYPFRQRHQHHGRPEKQHQGQRGKRPPRVR